MKKRLQLEILDNSGEVITTHHFNYEQQPNHRVRVSIDGKTFYWEPDINFNKDFKQTTEKPEPKYFNPKTGETQKLFCEEVLVPAWRVRYKDQNIWVEVVLSARDEQDAKSLALACTDFNQYITPDFYDNKHLSVSAARGNYVIGKVCLISTKNYE